jgi:hypothetical protein
LINFVTVAGLGGPLRHLLPTLDPPTRRWSYERLVRKTRLPMGTWIFTDHERMSAFELNVAAAVAEQLQRAGCKVINHPAQVKSRAALLDALWRAGINAFRAFRADEAPQPTRFPVFIRREYDHRGDARELIHSQAELDAALAALRADGVPLQGRLVIEYAGQESAPGIWYRGSSYRVDDTIIAHHLALDRRWLVKDGFGAAELEAYPDREAFLAQERAFVMNNEYAEQMRQVFDIAGIQYGRVDFGFLDGRLQIYEINTNPTHASEKKVFGGIHPKREDVQRHSERRLHEALNATDTDATGMVQLSGPLLKRQRQVFPVRPAAMRRN